MREIIGIVLCILFAGCISVVDESEQGRKVKSFIITSDEALDLIERIDKVSPQDKKEIRLFSPRDKQEPPEDTPGDS